MLFGLPGQGLEAAEVLQMAKGLRPQVGAQPVQVKVPVGAVLLVLRVREEPLSLLLNIRD